MLKIQGEKIIFKYRHNSNEAMMHLYSFQALFVSPSVVRCAAVRKGFPFFNRHFHFHNAQYFIRFKLWLQI